MINKIYSMRIDSDAVAILRIIKCDSLIHTTWFRDTLSEKQINFLSSEINRLKKIKVDTIIHRSHIDGAGATIIIQADSNKVFVELHSSEKTNESFNQLLDFIKSFSKDSGFTQTDSVNVFESLNLNTFPPPPKTIKFTPPIIKPN